MNVNKRNNTIDLIKGWAIIFVVYGHVIQILYTGTDMNFFDDFIEKIICSFHMPLFAAVSGYLYYSSYNRKSLKNLLASRFLGIGWPLLLWSSVYYFGYQVILELVSGAGKISFYDWWNTFSGSFLWFLWSILICSVFTAVAFKTGKFKFVAVVLMFFLAFLLPNSEYTAFLYPFFVFGFIFHEKEDNFKKLWDYKLMYLIFVVYAILLLFYEEKHYIYTTGINIFTSKYSWIKQLYIDVYRYIMGFLGIFSVFLIIKKTQRFYSSFLNRVISFFGKKSLEIYIIQCMAVSWIFSLAYYKFVSSEIGVEFSELMKNNIILDFVAAPIITIFFIF